MAFPCVDQVSQYCSFSVKLFMYFILRKMSYNLLYRPLLALTVTCMMSSSFKMFYMPNTVAKKAVLTKKNLVGSDLF